MSIIQIIGLGAGEDDLTVRAQKLYQKNTYFARTDRHTIVNELRKYRYCKFDDYFEKYETFNEVYENIINTLIEKSNNTGKLTTVQQEALLRRYSNKS